MQSRRKRLEVNCFPAVLFDVLLSVPPGRMQAARNLFQKNATPAFLQGPSFPDRPGFDLHNPLIPRPVTGYGCFQVKIFNPSARKNHIISAIPSILFRELQTAVNFCCDDFMSMLPVSQGRRVQNIRRLPGAAIRENFFPRLLNLSSAMRQCV